MAHNFETNNNDAAAAVEPVAVLNRVPDVHSSRETYAVFHKSNIKNESNKSDDKEISCLFSLDPIDQHNKRKTVSHLRFGANSTFVSITYMMLEPARVWFATKNIDPLTRLPIKSALRQRIEVAMKALTHGDRELVLEEIPALFREFCADPAAFKATHPIEYDLMRRDLHIGDAGILSTWNVPVLDIRKKAEEKLLQHGVGSWLIRSGSIQSTNTFISQVISYCYDNNSIYPQPIAHVFGFGYILINVIGVARGQLMPDIGNDKSMPAYTHVFPSFIDLLEHLSTKMTLSKMVIDE